MLYRIAIYKIVDGKRVFDHHASDEELVFLKPMPNGKVAKLQVVSHLNLMQADETYGFGPDEGLELFDLCENFGKCDLILNSDYEEFTEDDERIGVRRDRYWQDASNTHEVEWGFEKDGKEYYENGVYRHTNCKEISGNYRAVTGVYDLLITINYLSNYAGELVCIGNIHEESK